MEKSVILNNKKIRYGITYGSKRSIVLIGGIIIHHHKAYLEDFFVKKDYTVILPKLILKKQKNNLHQITEQLQRIMQEENIKKPIIIGLKEGGTIAMRYVAETDNASKIFLVDPVGKSFSYLDYIKGFLIRSLVFLIKARLWYDTHLHKYLFYLECLEYDRNIVLTDKPIILIEHADMFHNQHDIEHFQSVHPKISLMTLSGNRINTKRPYELINIILNEI